MATHRKPPGLGLTDLGTDELERLLRHIHRGELPCPVRADTLACVGLQHRSELLLQALRGLDEAAARALLVCVLAERRAQARRAAPRTPPPDRHPQVCNADAVDWREEQRDGTVRLRRRQLGRAAGGQKLGASLIELLPGQRSWPYHAHLANEEALYILSGHPLLRLGSAFIELHPGDYVALPPGAAHAHQLINRADDAARYLCLSTMESPDVAIYPDSDKVAVFAGAAPGGDPTARTLTAFFRQEDAVDYWTDEP